MEPADITDLSTPCLVQNLLDGLSTKGYSIITPGKTSTGECWSNTTRLKERGSYIKYATNGQYGFLSGVIAPSSQLSSEVMAKVTVYDGSDIIPYTSQGIHYNEKLMHFDTDVTGQNKIRVKTSLTMDNEWDDPIILIDGPSLYKQAG